MRNLTKNLKLSSVNSKIWDKTMSCIRNDLTHLSQKQILLLNRNLQHLQNQVHLKLHVRVQLHMYDNILEQQKSPVINNNTIPQYFQKNNLCFDQQGDEFYLQDKDFIKNSPKIQPLDTEEDALTIYSQLQKKSYYIQYLHHFN